MGTLTSSKKPGTYIKTANNHSNDRNALLYRPKSIGKITSVKINPKGTYVSLLTAVSLKGAGGASRAPSTAVYLYDIEKDVVLTRDFAPHTVRLPLLGLLVSHFFTISADKSLLG